MPERPTGTVTFLFSDIEGSTRLLQQLRGEYDEVLSTHARLLRAAIEQFDGHEIAVNCAASPAMVSWLGTNRANSCLSNLPSLRLPLCRRSSGSTSPPGAKNVALCGLRLDGFHALLVQGRIAYSVGSGSEKSVSDARSVNASAAPLTPHVPKLLL